MIPTIDQLDAKILGILQADGKISNLKLAEKISLAPTSTLDKVKKLELQGFIQSYHAKLNPTKLSLQVNIWLQIFLNALTKENIKIFQQAIQKLPEVTSCYHVMGNADFLLNVFTTDMTAYQNLLICKLSTIPVIKSIQAMTVLSTSKDHGLPILT
jgi:Lrp/AsnC family leucine-responsive transcriptional regulator